MASEALVTAFRLQIGGCRFLGSDLYARLLEHALGDLEAGGPTARLLADWAGDPLRGFLPLRLMGAVHERALAGEAPELARFYPSLGGEPRWPDAWHAFRGVLDEQREALLPRLQQFPQTNEVRRCAGLLGGFLALAARWKLPLRLREIGASAGLHLLFHRYRYELGPHRWGADTSPVAIASHWEGVPARFDAPLEVESGAGCDLAPVDVTDAAQRRLLEAYVWADQTERLAPLRAALELARRAPPPLFRSAAADWLAGELAGRARGVTTVVFHSAVWLYLGAEEQQRVRALLEEHGARCDPTAPLAWLRHEDDPERPGHMQIRLRTWPEGEDALLGHGHPHGRRVRWQGD